ncbi:MAG TPA: dTMP kinase [Candidatus Saccharimonadales bacterium]|nr:dTMP kinase [Candidatus Saccharimonadales bacterium]
MCTLKGVETSGLIVCFEGIDGAGKNTQARMLKRRLETAGVKTESYSYPDYKGRYGRIIRAYLDRKIEMGVDEFLLLHMLDKQKDRRRIERGLEKGEVLIMDRYLDSVVAYQSAGGFPYDSAKKIVLLFGMPPPDIVIYLDIPVRVSTLRKNRQRHGVLDRHESSAAYLNKVRGVYNKLYAERFGCGTWVRIDGTGGAAAVHEKVFLEVNKLM